MTDESLVGGVDAPAETPALEQEQVRIPEPLSSQTPVADKPEAKEPVKPEAPKTASDAIKRAQEQLKAKEAEAAKVAKPAEKPKEEPKADKARDDTGKFTPKEAAKATEQPQDAQKPTETPAAPDPSSPHRDAPSRFSSDAKAAWETAPEPIKAEVHRAIRELEQGHQKYKADADRYEQFRQFDETAKANGRDFATDSIPKVIQFETMMRQNPVSALEFALREAGPRKADGTPVTLLDVAAHVMNQKPEDRAMQQNSTIAALQSELGQLKQQLSGVTQSIQQQAQNATVQQVQAFAKDHPRFDDLSSDIEFFLKSGRTKDLSEAYTLAERLNPAPAASKPEPAAAPVATQPKPLNPAGQKSIAGAPSSGSNPTGKKAPAPSIREALRRASAQVG